jgi:hypothetical protein
MSKPAKAHQTRLRKLWGAVSISVGRRSFALPAKPSISHTTAEPRGGERAAVQEASRCRSQWLLRHRVPHRNRQPRRGR